jgi:hypothetical protein
MLTSTANEVATRGPMASSQVGGEPEYLDDRSRAERVVQSYFNAINRKEYARAYSYWEPAAAESQLPPYEEFEGGYANTAHVDVSIGEVHMDVGAGQLYYAVPVALDVTTTDGTGQFFAGCYILHLARPRLQAVPPFHPMGIRSATVGELPLGTDPNEALARPCGP